MRYKTHILIPVCLLLLSLVSCSGSEKPAETADQAAVNDTAAVPPPAMDSLNPGPAPATSTQQATEEFHGNYNGKDVLLSHMDFQSYTLNIGGQVTSGSLNTERGYGDDRDATIYVLDSDKPKKEQKYFVRTSQGSFYMLDRDKYVVDDAYFDPVKVAVPVPAAAKKPAKVEEAVAKPVEKKPVVAEEKPKTETAKKAESVKKASTKKQSAKNTKKKSSSKKQASAKASGKDTVKAAKKTPTKTTKKKKVRKSSKKKKPTAKKTKKKSRKSKKRSTAKKEESAQSGQ